jgi:hypothetical protein
MISAAVLERAGLQDPDVGISRCDEMLAKHMEVVRRRFGPSALGVIDLPSLGTGSLVPGQIRVCGVLYWASELEEAGLLPFVEALANGVVRGSVVVPLGGAIPELTRFWRTREQRFGATERRALFARIFGTGTGAAASPFVSQFDDLVRALMDVGRSPMQQGTGYEEARVAVLAQQLGSSLSTAGAGIAAFAAREITTQSRTALRLLQHGDVARALGSGGPWQIITRLAPQLLGRRVRPDVHISRATSGLRIINWIAAEAATIESGSLRLARTSSVIRDAETWSAARGVG